MLVVGIVDVAFAHIRLKNSMESYHGPLGNTQGLENILDKHQTPKRVCLLSALVLVVSLVYNILCRALQPEVTHYEY